MGSRLRCNWQQIANGGDGPEIGQSTSCASIASSVTFQPCYRATLNGSPLMATVRDNERKNGGMDALEGSCQEKGRDFESVPSGLAQC